MKAAACLLTVILLGLLIVCPLAACRAVSTTGDNAPPGCCHKSTPQPAQCPMPSVQDCPYFILDKGDLTRAAVFVAPADPGPSEVVSIPAPAFAGHGTPAGLPKADGLYLRLHVLLI